MEIFLILGIFLAAIFILFFAFYILKVYRLKFLSAQAEASRSAIILLEKDRLQSIVLMAQNTSSLLQSDITQGTADGVSISAQPAPGVTPPEAEVAPLSTERARWIISICRNLQTSAESCLRNLQNLSKLQQEKDALNHIITNFIKALSSSNLYTHTQSTLDAIDRIAQEISAQTKAYNKMARNLQAFAGRFPPVPHYTRNIKIPTANVFIRKPPKINF